MSKNDEKWGFEFHKFTKLKNDKTVMPVIGVFEQFFVDFTKLIILSQKSDIVRKF